jgi:hypothetical protein
MQIDQDRIRAILKGEHSYYGGDDIPIRRDERWCKAVARIGLSRIQALFALV